MARPAAAAVYRAGVWRWADDPWRVLLLAAVLSASVALAGLAARDWDASRFVVAGRVFTDPAAAPPDLAVSPGRGFDGQFFYRLGLDPLTDRRTDSGITLDDPPYRQQRVLYSSLAWLLSLGQSQWLPWAMLAINVAGLAGIGLLSAAVAGSLGYHRLWGLAVTAYPGLTMSLWRDTSEIVAVAALLGGLASVLHRRPVLAATCLSAAVLARETTAVLPVAGLAWAGWQWWRRRQAAHPPDTMAGGGLRSALVAFGIPLACLAAWHSFLAARWGRAPMLSGTGGLSLPLKAPLTQAWESATDGTASGVRLALQIVVVLALVAWSVWRARRWSGDGLVLLAFLLSAVVPLLLAGDAWTEDWGFVRPLSETAALGLLVAASGPNAVPLGLMVALVALVLPSL